MSTPKPFLSYSQQINKLSIEKNLVIKDKQFAKKALQQIGYFSLISGYKDLYRNPTTKRYKDGTTFEEIVALYKFDENLRELFLKYLLIIEQEMRSLLSYYFTEHYGEHQSNYLSMSSYNPHKKHSSGIRKLINTLKSIAIDIDYYPYITYQRNKYGNVPLWVLVKVLTFGNITHMYRYIHQHLQIKISRNYTNVNEKELIQYFRVLTKFRNVCAHNERLYSYSTIDDIPDTPIHSKLMIPKKGSQYIYGKNDLFCVVIALRYLLDKDDFIQFKRRLARIITKFIKETSQISENDLLSHMGFPLNWKKISSLSLR